MYECMVYYYWYFKKGSFSTVMFSLSVTNVCIPPVWYQMWNFTTDTNMWTFCTAHRSVNRSCRFATCLMFSLLQYSSLCCKAYSVWTFPWSVFYTTFESVLSSFFVVVFVVVLIDLFPIGTAGMEILLQVLLISVCI